MEIYLAFSARVIHSTFNKDVTLKEIPTLGQYESFPDDLLCPGVRTTYFLRPTQTRRRRNVFFTPATYKHARKTVIWAQSRAFDPPPRTSCRVGRLIIITQIKLYDVFWFNFNLFNMMFHLFRIQRMTDANG